MVSSFGFPLNQSNDTKDSVVGTQWGGYNAEVGGYNGGYHWFHRIVLSIELSHVYHIVEYINKQ